MAAGYAVVWSGDPPDKCGLPTCGRRIRSIFIDGAVQQGGWMVMCPGCHRIRSVGIGPRKGHVYERRLTDNRFVCTA